MKIDFYHWSYQCPINAEMIDLLREYEGSFELRLHDITGRPELAKEMRMFYPTLTVVDGRYRFYSPLDRAFLDALCGGTIPAEEPYRPSLGTRELVGEIVPLTRENCAIAGRCTGRTGAGCESCAARKARFLEECRLEIFGFLNLHEGGLAGGAEYLPSLLVPYDIPRGERTAFITCVYLSDPEFDGKSAPLRALERYLAGTYDRALVVSEEEGVFPNGDVAFFLRNGYRDLGVVASEDYCTLHLMEKRLTAER